MQNRKYFIRPSNLLHWRWHSLRASWWRHGSEDIIASLLLVRESKRSPLEWRAAIQRTTAIINFVRWWRSCVLYSPQEPLFEMMAMVRDTRQLRMVLMILRGGRVSDIAMDAGGDRGLWNVFGGYYYACTRGVDALVGKRYVIIAVNLNPYMVGWTLWWTGGCNCIRARSQH